MTITLKTKLTKAQSKIDKAEKAYELLLKACKHSFRKRTKNEYEEDREGKYIIATDSWKECSVCGEVKDHATYWPYLGKHTFRPY